MKLLLPWIDWCAGLLNMWVGLCWNEAPVLMAPDAGQWRDWSVLWGTLAKGSSVLRARRPWDNCWHIWATLSGFSSVGDSSGIGLPTGKKKKEKFKCMCMWIWHTQEWINKSVAWQRIISWSLIWNYPCFIQVFNRKALG